jgi:hypothetical protein
LLSTINDNGELEKYWAEVEKKNEEARRAARRLEKERKRLEMGSDYETTGSTDEDGPGDYEDDDLDSDDYGSEEGEEEVRTAIKTLIAEEGSYKEGGRDKDRIIRSSQIPFRITQIVKTSR